MTVFYLILLCWPFLQNFCLEISVEQFLKKYPSPPYQDVLIQNNTIIHGTDLCDSRFELLKPILNLYDKPFKLLDLGAAQGYFSFRVAYDYPHSCCIMIDANTTTYYKYARHGNMLYDLCLLNSELTNIVYLNKIITISDLSFLHQHEHFDIILAFLVIHLMYDQS
jgi:hypothetical protein